MPATPVKPGPGELGGPGGPNGGRGGWAEARVVRKSAAPSARPARKGGAVDMVCDLIKE
jgi:hypothetical protein